MGEAEKSWQRLTADYAESSNQGKPGEEPPVLHNIAVDVARVDERRNEMNDRSCGKVPVRLIRVACATVIPLSQRVAISCLFVFVGFNGGSAKATVMTGCSSFIFLPIFFFAPLFPSPPALCRYLLPLLRVVFVRETAVIFLLLDRATTINSNLLSSSCWFLRAAGICPSSARTCVKTFCFFCSLPFSMFYY